MRRKVLSDVGTRTIACTKGGPSEYDFAYAETGKVIESDVLTVSADGTSLSVQKTIQRPRPPIPNEPYRRRSGTSGLGLAGSWTDYWRSDGFGLTTDTYGITTMTLPITNPDHPSKKTIAVKLDGSPWQFPAPSHPSGLVCSAKSVGPNEFFEGSRVGITHVSRTIYAFNPGGKTMTVSSRIVGKESLARLAYHLLQ